MLLEIKEMEFVDKDTVKVKCEYHVGNLGAGGYTYTVKRESGRLKVKYTWMDWIA